jgi:recombinational DNA repair ATPase RecF
MRLQHITVDHILGLRKVDLPITRRILVVGAPNAAGKSSLAECIRLALLAESPRVPLRKDYGELVHRGATAGMVEVKTDAGTTTVHITAAGKVQTTTPVNTVEIRRQ